MRDDEEAKFVWAIVFLICVMLALVVSLALK